MALDFGQRLPASEISYELPPVDGWRVLALDLETTGLSPITDSIVAVLLHVNGTTYIRRPDEPTKQWLTEVLSRRVVVVTQNGHAFDLPFIARWLGTLDFRPSFFDTTVAAAVLEPREPTGLEKLIARWLGIEVPKDRTLTKWGFMWPPDAPRMTADQERYCHDDVRYLEPLAERLMQEADSREPSRRGHIQLEHQIRPSITSLHLALMPVDKARVRKALAEEEKKLAVEIGAISELGIRNPRSHVEIMAFLKRAGIHIDDTQELTLSDNADSHPMIRSLLRMRKAERSAGTLSALLSASLAEGGFRGS